MHLSFLTMETDDMTEDMKPPELEQQFAEIMAEVQKQYARIEELNNQFPDNITVGLFWISCKEIKTASIEKHTKIITKINAMIQNLIKLQLNDVITFKENLIAELAKNPPEIRSLSDMKKFIQELPIQITEMNNKSEALMQMYEFLEG